MEQAMARAEAATGTAQHSLLQASQQAGAQHVGLSESGSYSDYLARKQDAAKAWAAVAGPGNNPRSVRGALAQGAMGAGRMADADLADREQRLGERNSGNAASWEAYNRGIQERAAAAQRDADKRKTDDEANRNSFLSGVYARWIQDHQDGQIGGGTEDRQRHAQILSGGIDQGWTLPGLTPEQRANAAPGQDRRGWGIESDAWGRTSRPSGRPTTRKGTAY